MKLAKDHDLFAELKAQADAIPAHKLPNFPPRVPMTASEIVRRSLGGEGHQPYGWGIYGGKTMATRRKDWAKTRRALGGWAMVLGLFGLPWLVGVVTILRWMLR